MKNIEVTPLFENITAIGEMSSDEAFQQLLRARLEKHPAPL